MELRLVPEAAAGMLFLRLVGRSSNAASALGHTIEVSCTSWPQHQVSK